MMGELAIIQRIRQLTQTRNSAVRIGIGDDCAVVKPLPGHEMVVTTDLCLEGRHFRRDWHTPESAGHRCLARGLSDVAAMGARPLTAFLSLALPKNFDEDWFDGFMGGFQALAAEFGVELAGGDTAEAPGHQILADVTVIGTTAKLRAMRRSTARAGDHIYVSGKLGGAAAELAAMANGSKWDGAAQPQSFPQPRVALGQKLAKRPWATACIDLSDGLSTDLRHLCEASKLRAEVDPAKIPVAEAATLEQALHGGEDYELLFTVMHGVKMPLSILGIPLTCIGRMTAGEGVGLIGGGELKRGGWEHLT